MTTDPDIWAAAAAAQQQALVITDEGGNLVAANAAAVELLKQSPEALTGLALDDLVAQRPELAWLATPFDHASRTWQSVALYDDSLHRQAAEHLAVKLKADTFGDLASNIAHEFNNHLGGASGFAQMALANVGDEERVRNCLEEIVEATDSGARQIARIMVFGQQQLLEPEPITVGQHVADCEGLIRPLISPGIEFSLEVEDVVSKALLSPGRMAEAILEMCENAMHAMAETDGGRLEVRLVRREMTKTDLRTFYDAEPGPYLCLSISDNGSGMSEKSRRNIFDPLYTTQDIGEGGGLGMSVVYSILSRSGGMLDVKSEPGEGTTIAAYLPVIG